MCGGGGVVGGEFVGFFVRNWCVVGLCPRVVVVVRIGYPLVARFCGVPPHGGGDGFALGVADSWFHRGFA